MADDTQKLDAGEEQEVLQSGEDVANAALAAAQEQFLDAGDADDVSEAAQSDNLAETLEYLQNIIERNAVQLQDLKDELKLKRQSLRNVFENDTQLSEASEQAQELKQKVKERKSQVQNSPQAVQLKTQIKELNQQKKEIEETLSNHLINYHSLTNSTSFDTSDGDQWEFKIKAKVKTRRKS